MCAVCGVLVMALPIPIVVDNFADYYQEQKKIEAKELKAEAQVQQERLKPLKDLFAFPRLLKTSGWHTSTALPWRDCKTRFRKLIQIQRTSRQLEQQEPATENQSLEWSRMISPDRGGWSMGGRCDLGF